ncbi:MAG TPA: hypothetical protein VF595_01660 [Tepidisphaeraceae bacterium]
MAGGWWLVAGGWWLVAEEWIDRQDAKDAKKKTIWSSLLGVLGFLAV